MKVPVPEIDQHFTIHTIEVRPENAPAHAARHEMPDLIAVLTTGGTLLECNRAALAAAVSNRQDVIDKPIWETFWWGATPATRAELRMAVAAASRGQLVRCEIEVNGRNDGTNSMTMDLMFLPLRDHTGEVVFLLLEGRDVSGEKQFGRGITRKPEETLLDPAVELGRSFRGACERAGLVLSVKTGGAAQPIFAPQVIWEGILLDLVSSALQSGLAGGINGKNGAEGGQAISDLGSASNECHQPADIDWCRKAAQTSALLSAIVDSCDDAIISKDLNGIIRSWNKSAERLFGYTAEEAVGRSIAILIPPDRQEEEPKILAQLRRGERVDHFETIRVRKDGSLLNISLTISPIKDADGRVIGASKVARDITERVRQAQALEEANAALRRANMDLEQFAYSASHDLQEPLRMVAAYSELLQRRFVGKLGPIADEYISHTVQGAMRMEKLLKDLRTYTQLSMSDHQPPGEIDAGEVLKKTLLNLEAAIRDSGATISSGPLPRIRMFEFQLEQVFQNLIGNAIRYRRDVPPVIHVEAVSQGRECLFSVQDNGIGIEPQFKEQIFGIFKRLHSAGEYPGTGMGLAICQRIIDRAGGRIWVESEPGRGSTFYFTVVSGKREHAGNAAETRLDYSDRGQPGGRRIGA